MSPKTLNQRLIFTILSIIALIVYLFHPTKYVYSYNLYCMLMFLGSVVLFLIFKKKKNYFDFDILFLTTCFFAFFAYPVLIYPIDPLYFFVFDLGYDRSVISQGTALSLLGLEVYMTGSIYYEKNTKESLSTISFYPIKSFTFITGLLLILFLAFGGYNFYVNLYSGIKSIKGGVFTYINILLITFLMVSICMQYTNLLYKDPQRLKMKYVYKPFIFLIGSYVIIILSTGSRTVPLQVVLAILGIYTLVYKPFSLKKTAIFIGIGVLVLASITYARMGNGEISNIYDAFMDIIIVNRNTFAAIEYVNNHDYTLGSSMLSYLLQPIPFGQSIVISIFNLDSNYISSAALLTTEALGETRSLGLGTNIIADIYLSFGAVGVIVFLFFAGWFVAKSKHLALYKTNYMIIYTVLVANSVFLVRAEFFYCLQEILWSLIIFYFTKPLFSKRIKILANNRMIR